MGALETKQTYTAHNLACSSIKGNCKIGVAFEGINNGSIVTGNKPLDLVTPQVVTKTSLQPGMLSKTDVETDVAIQGNGFFKFTDTTGNIFFSRNGSLHFNESGVLVDGENKTLEGESGPIQSPQSGAKISIDKQGHVFEGTQEIGRLVAYELPESLTTKVARPLNSAEASEAKISQGTVFASGFLEESNVSPIREMVEMITVSRAHEANSHVIKQIDGELSEALQILGNTNS